MRLSDLLACTVLEIRPADVAEWAVADGRLQLARTAAARLLRA